MIATGNHVKGGGQAHKFNHVYRAYFNCPMFSTFNVRTDTDLDMTMATAMDHPEGGVSNLWLVKINEEHYAWAYRSPNTKQSLRTWELVSKRPLPDSLKTGELRLKVLEKYNEDQIQKWVNKHWTHSWHQSFDWAGRKSADSQLLWDTMEPHADWSGSLVMDFGTGWGYHAQKASHAGASVVGVELDTTIAREVNDNIEMQDVRFVKKDPGGLFDVIIYTSVHHQLDPKYERLAACLDSYRARCSTLFVELIRPPMFGTEERLKSAVNAATHLLTYKHNIRGMRSVYKFNGNQK
jgi:2-polyprenyl-3-methyl-5-hydroxy-6-metoxy-1,4-benzoquinol methylase